MTFRLWTGRILIFLVAAWNIQAAIFLFLNTPSLAYTLNLPGIAGSTLIRGTGILFLIWNVPYLFATFHPVQNRISLVESLLMQSVALIGELILANSSPEMSPTLQNTFSIYIRFDSAGLLLLLFAAIITWRIPASIRLNHSRRMEAS